MEVKTGNHLREKTDQTSVYCSRSVEPDTIDKGQIYDLTKKINDCLHREFGMKSLNHRMIFTACTLVAVKEGAALREGMEFSSFYQMVLDRLSEAVKEAKIRNGKLELLCQVFSEIKMNTTENQQAMDHFTGWVAEISKLVSFEKWNGEDVMAIFFHEFNRYKDRSESGQVFTPDHITSFLCRLIDVSKNDIILDAACGSGAFLVKAMCNMVKEAGGSNTEKAVEIKEMQLYGIEFDREIFALAFANMLLHKNNRIHLEQMDSRLEEASGWIKGIRVKLKDEDRAKGVTKVLMNPPFERAYGCMSIVKTVLDSVPAGAVCAFILPDKKLEKNRQIYDSDLKKPVGYNVHAGR